MFDPLLDYLSRDPVFSYSMLAIGILLTVSLLAGWLRRDYRPLLRPTGLIHIATAVVIGVLLLLLSQNLSESLRAFDGLAWLMGASDAPTWPIGGIQRLPLYIVALGYGPTAGLLTAALFAAFEGSGGMGWSAAILVVELVVLGWLAIYPSPKEFRWAGPLNVALAYLLAWVPGGIALLQWREGVVTMSGFWTLQQHTIGGLVITAGLLYLVHPQIYRDLFADSTIGPEGQPDPYGEGLDQRVVLESLSNGRSNRQRSLEQPLVGELSRSSRQRRLQDDPPFDAL